MLKMVRERFKNVCVLFFIFCIVYTFNTKAETINGYEYSVSGNATTLVSVAQDDFLEYTVKETTGQTSEYYSMKNIIMSYNTIPGLINTNVLGSNCYTMMYTNMIFLL